MESRSFIPFLVWCEQGKYSKLLPDCCKMALFAVQFSGSMPQDLPRKAPTFGSGFIHDRKSLTFPENPAGSTGK